MRSYKLLFFDEKMCSVILNSSIDPFDIFICFSQQPLSLVEINQGIYSSQSQLMIAEKTNEDRTTRRTDLFQTTQYIPDFI